MRYKADMRSVGMAKISHVMSLMVVIGLWNPNVIVVSGSKHVSIKNNLGSGKNMSLHCQSKDNDLGTQNIVYGDEFGWDFSDNVIGSTLFFCDLGWQNVQQFHFDAYSFARDMVRCDGVGCSWLVAAEGIYGLNGQTGFWEFLYQWPN
ncbi:Self-incompatibility protein S1, partial [Mucuna pruriens]